MEIKFGNVLKSIPAWENETPKEMPNITGKIIRVKGPLENQEASLKTAFTSRLKRAVKIGVDLISALTNSFSFPFSIFFIFDSLNPARERLYKGESNGRMINGIEIQTTTSKRMYPIDFRFSPVVQNTIPLENQFIGGKKDAMFTTFVTEPNCPVDKNNSGSIIELMDFWKEK